MPAFEYQAIDSKGKRVKGFLECDSTRHARQLLRENSLIPLEVSQVHGDVSNGTKKSSTWIFNNVFQSNSAKRRWKLNNTDLALITRQFATLLESGLTIEECLSVLIAQTERHKTRSILTGIKSKIIEGFSFVNAIEEYPRSFPEIYRAAVSAGEHSGNLEVVMDNLANYLEERQNLQQRLSIALIYPIILTTVSVIIVMALLTFVVPKVVVVFEGANQTLPLLTRVMISIGDFLKTHFATLAIFVIAVVFGLTALFRRPKPRLWLDNQTLKFTLTKRLSREINSARLARTLAIMIQSGVPLLTAMRSAEGVLTNLVLRMELQQSAVDVSEGSSIHKSLLRHNRFSPLLAQMIASGEASGRLGEMLDKAANALEIGVKNRLAVIMGLFEPLVILVMGGLVMLIVLAILLPVFDMNTLIN